MKPNEFFKKRFGIMEESKNDEELMSNLLGCIAEDCGGCPYKTDACKTGLLMDVNNLIERQQAEIERLKKIQQTQADRLIEERGQKYEQIEVISKLKKQLETTKFEVEKNRRIIQDHETIIEMLEKELKTAKSKTIKEFAEKLKSKASLVEVADYFYAVAVDDIDELMKAETEEVVEVV